jgi:hypothetical protein
MNPRGRVDPYEIKLANGRSFRGFLAKFDGDLQTKIFLHFAEGETLPMKNYHILPATEVASF